MLEFILAVTFFTGVVMTLVLAILAARARMVPAGRVMLRINDKRSLPASMGHKLLTVLERSGIRLPSACGGRGTCGLCKVQLGRGRRAITPVEGSLLTPREIASGMRLACQLVIHGDLDIWLADDIYGVEHWHCRVRSSRFLTPLMKELILELPPGASIDFHAGAYVQVTCQPFRARLGELELSPQVREEWRRLGLLARCVDCQERRTRAYSLANFADEKAIVMLIVRLAVPPPEASAAIPPGVVSSYLFSRMPGVEVEVAGPFGHFFARDSAREMIFVGGGAGMAPMRSHILDQLKRLGTTRKISFWYGARSRRELCYVETFERLQREHDNFKWHVALSESTPGDNWQGDTGFIHEVLQQRYLASHPSPEDCEYYLCGPPLMVQAVRGLLDRLGVDAGDISTDDFGT
jgi:Na+-transporting NADH:ubiquinone oxidoreductase subunit F